MYSPVLPDTWKWFHRQFLLCRIMGLCRRTPGFYRLSFGLELLSRYRLGIILLNLNLTLHFDYK